MISPIERRDKPRDTDKRNHLPAPKGHRHSASSSKETAKISFQETLAAAMEEARRCSH